MIDKTPRGVYRHLSRETKMKTSDKQILVRPIKKGDFDRLFIVLSKAFKRELEIVGFDSQRFSRNAKLYSTLKFLLPIFNFLHLGFPTVLVAEADNKVVGEVDLVPWGKGIWTIDSLAVDPDYTGRGIGLSLIKGSVRYASQRGRKILTSIRADNLPALRIAEKLGYKIFEERVLLFHRLGDYSLAKVEGQNVLIRGAKSKDAKHIYEIAKAVDPEKVHAYEITPEDFVSSVSKTVSSKMIGTHSKSFVAEAGGKILGYAHIVYTSPLEAARIESFYIESSKNFSEVASSLLNKASSFLRARKIRKVTANFNVSSKDATESFTRFGFTPFAHVYSVDCTNRSNPQ